VVAEAYDLFRATLARTLPFSLLAVLLGQWPSVYLLQGGQSLQLLAPKSLGWWVIMSISSVGTLWCWLVIARRQRRGGKLLADLKAVSRALPRALGVVALAALLIALGGLMLVLPGIYLMVGFWPALAILLNESRSVRESLDRSLVLVRGVWWQSLGVLLVLLVAVLSFFVLGALAAFAMAQWLPMSVVTAVLAALFQPLVTATGWAHYRVLTERQASSSASNSL